jgi:hypothetical protein
MDGLTPRCHGWQGAACGCVFFSPYSCYVLCPLENLAASRIWRFPAGLVWDVNYKIVPNFPALYSAEVDRGSLKKEGCFVDELPWGDIGLVAACLLMVLYAGWDTLFPK